MPASSKAQQRFFGVVKSMQKGDKPKKGEAGKIAKQMSKKDVDKYASTKHKGKPEKVKREMKVRELIKKMVREELAGLDEAAKRDYKAEYKKFQSSDKSKKYRAELNKYNRQKGTYGNGDGKDASHKGGKIVGFEKESVNRGRAEKSRLKKEGKLIEVDFNKIKLPSQVNRFLDKFVQSMKGANLNRMKRASILYKVIDAAGMTPQQLMADIQKIKTAMKEEKLNERLHVVDERYVGKYIIWVLQDGNKIRTAVLGKKGFDNFSSNDPDDLKKLWNLSKKYKGKPIPDIATEGKLTEKKMDRKKAAIILKQIGGNRFIAMTGAKGFAFSDKYMSFKIGRNSKGINFVRIGHNAMDTYDMEFGFVSVKGIKVKKKVKGVYADMLGTMFKKYTGMNVSL